MARPFSLHRRPSKKIKRPIYFARFADPGDFPTTVTTRETSKVRAEAWALAELERRRAITAKRAERLANPTVAEYAAGFWEPTGFYAESRRVRGKSVSRGHLDIQESYTRNHVLPKWGHLPVAEITTAAVDRWVVQLHQAGTLAPATINKILQCLRSLLDGAVSIGAIAFNPATNVKPVYVTTVERGVLTDDEVRAVLVWPGPWRDYRMYALNTLAFATGARMGELRGLPVDAVHANHIEIRQSWEEKYGLKPPKYGSVRAVPISPHVSAVMQRLIEETRPTSLVFYGAAGLDRPMSKSHIEKNLHRAIVRMKTPAGLTAAERPAVTARISAELTARNIGVHSWRHKLNTVLRSAGVPDAKIRLLTGHRSSAMTDWYTRFQATDFTDVATVQTSLLESAV